nr:hypothetical protein Iba_chr12cCG12860 [Ipomoea batatas]
MHCVRVPLFQLAAAFLTFLSHPIPCLSLLSATATIMEDFSSDNELPSSFSPRPSPKRHQQCGEMAQRFTGYGAPVGDLPRFDVVWRELSAAGRWSSLACTQSLRSSFSVSDEHHSDNERSSGSSDSSPPGGAWREAATWFNGDQQHLWSGEEAAAMALGCGDDPPPSVSTAEDSGGFSSARLQRSSSAELSLPCSIPVPATTTGVTSICLLGKQGAAVDGGDGGFA